MVEKNSGHEKANLKEFASPYPVSRLAPANELIDLAKEISRADDLLALQASGKLKVLAKQMRLLQEEAQQILKETLRNQELHKAPCGFQKKIGQVYHLYKKIDGTLQFSMLSPEDWKGRPPHDFLGSYRLDNDMSWILVEKE